MNKAVALIFSLFIMAFAQGTLAAQYEEDVDYEVLSQPQQTSTGDKIEVIEFFWFGCPHCFQFESYLKRWKKKLGSDVEVVKIPAIFRPEWEIHARAYYTAKFLKVEDKIIDAMFSAIHEQKKHVNNESQVMAIFLQNGVSEKDFKRIYKSFAVESKVRKAHSLHRQYGVNSVPTMIVNGKYRTHAGLAGGHAQVLKVTDFLINKERNK